ncbi:MAG: hypothetical protein WDN03_16345 [Rhizomicrobium sp.]
MKLSDRELALLDSLAGEAPRWPDPKDGSERRILSVADAIAFRASVLGLRRGSQV